ncbi:hypothetical protein [Corynebacterium epidermidicanis]|uniref:Uncharacterized protein n=1 Tax=Corynebacterium epidermidicanis TaxID=1050174 RepID=A0A0G3GP09_9CORY|nr:hypothetical protein [Corynebacterium epidermidicanis]AKK02966.1 hypothetical protein CEPID_05485 [Corynebacterium epidermidicanis]
MWKFRQALGLVQVDPLDTLIDLLEQMPAELQELPGNDPRVVAWLQDRALLEQPGIAPR